MYSETRMAAFDFLLLFFWWWCCCWWLVHYSFILISEPCIVYGIRHKTVILLCRYYLCVPHDLALTYKCFESQYFYYGIVFVCAQCGVMLLWWQFSFSSFYFPSLVVVCLYVFIIGISYCSVHFYRPHSHAVMMIVFEFISVTNPRIYKVLAYLCIHCYGKVAQWQTTKKELSWELVHPKSLAAVNIS